VSDTDSADLCLTSLRHVSGLLEAAVQSGLTRKSQPELLVAVCELILEGLHAQKKISRSDERGYAAAKAKTRDFGFESMSRSGKIN
jgi:magnesium chelatase subunit I